MTPVTTHDLEEVRNASPTRLIVILYDEAIIAMERAIDDIASNDIESRCKSVERTTEIVAHLCASLDLVGGGNVAANLARIYEFLIARLIQVNFRDDASIAAEIIRHLAMLRESWIEVDARNATEEISDDFVPASISEPASGEKRSASRAA